MRGSFLGGVLFEDIQPVGGFGNNYFGGWLHAGE